MRCPNRRDGLVAAVVLLLLFLPRISRSDPANATPETSHAAVFLELCSPCHTVGGGVLTGPDLATIAGWPRDKLRAAVKRMEDNTGPLTDEQIDELVELLQKPDAKNLIDAANAGQTAAPAAQPPAEPQLGSPATGHRLFYGEQPLANGGPPCFACHAVAGRGGNLAIDLTTAFARLGVIPLLSTAQKPAFPLMKAGYAARAVTPDEALHLAAFLKQSSANAPPAAPPRPERIGAVHGAAGGLTLLVLAGVALTARLRRSGVRSRLLRESNRRSAS